MNASEILVIILATALAISLVLGIVLLVILIRISRQIQAITNSAKLTVDNVQNIVANVGKAAAPAVTSRFIMEQIQRLFDRQQDRKRSK